MLGNITSGHQLGGPRPSHTVRGSTVPSDQSGLREPDAEDAGEEGRGRRDEGFSGERERERDKPLRR